MSCLPRPAKKIPRQGCLLVRRFLFVVCGSLFFLPNPSAAQEAPLKQLERIGIQAGVGGAQFILKDSKKTFFAEGFNYVRLREVSDGGPRDHATFEAATKTTKTYYDPEQAEVMFTALSKVGFNTVRVFVVGRQAAIPGIGGDYDTTKGIYEPYMDNFLDFLRRATRHGIRILPNFSDADLPLNAYFRKQVRGEGHARNLVILSREGVAASTEYLTLFLSYIKEKEPALLPTLLGLQCQNEASLNAKEFPFDQNNGNFTAANGKTYDLSNTDQRQALMTEGYVFYHDRIITTVKEIDPEILVSEGVFVPRAVGKDPMTDIGVWPREKGDQRYPPTLTTLGSGKLDFLDVHFYRTHNSESVDEAFGKNLGSTNFFTPEMTEIRKQKPIIIGEFGAFDFVEKTTEESTQSMARVRDLALQEKINGMLYWTYDCFEQPQLHHAAKDWPQFIQKMGDFQTVLPNH